MFFLRYIRFLNIYNQSKGFTVYKKISILQMRSSKSNSWHRKCGNNGIVQHTAVL